jgi:hypothetical protein
MRKFESEKGKPISSHRIVKVKQMNHIIEVMHLLKPSDGFQTIKKLSKTEYVLLSTGEVKEYNLTENRGQNIAGLKGTFRKIRDLINTNFTGTQNELHITLTYAENMTDTKRLLTDFDAFWKRYKRKYGQAEYMSVIEPQGRGAWHCHLLIRNLDPIYIPADQLAEMWGHGFIKIKSLKDVDNIGAYLSAYLGDIELTPENFREAKDHGLSDMQLKEVEVEGKKKAFIKGGRLHLYPSGMNLYRHSKGIVFPEVEKMSYQDTKKIVGSRSPNYSRTVTIYDDNEQVLNEITYEQYNLKATR